MIQFNFNSIQKQSREQRKYLNNAERKLNQLTCFYSNKRKVKNTSSTSTQKRKKKKTHKSSNMKKNERTRTQRRREKEKKKRDQSVQELKSRF
jgi:hypothetical protein